MRRRNFEIIRWSDLIGSSFLFNSVRVKYVATCPETCISFYVNNGQGGVVGVRVYPDGRKVLVNPENVDWIGKHGKAVYLQFRHAFGGFRYILASHAVYIAWRGKPIPKGMTIDHIDGCTTNNFIGNLRCIDGKTNIRDGGFLTKLRNKGINTTTILRPYLLRYFLRMATIKPALGWLYEKKLTKNDLMLIIFNTDSQISNHFLKLYNIKITFNYAQ